MPAVPGRVPHADRLAEVELAFRTLPERYLGAHPGFDVTYHIKLCDVGHTWEIRCTAQTARVRKGASRRQPDVTLSTDADTWMSLREGKFSGVDAFQRRLLSVRGNLDWAIAFEGMFRLPGGRPPLLRIHDVPVGRHRISTLTMGEGPDVLLIHGLGGTRASFMETAAALSTRYRVHAPDLPGFGASCKPALGSYNARWFADIMVCLMDELGIERAHLVGNSMGGRIAIELGLNHPDRVGALVLLCPAVAWIRRGFHPIVRLLRPEFGFLPHHIRRSIVAAQFWSIFHDRDVIDPAMGDLMVDEFQRIYQSAGARYAFLASAHDPRIGVAAFNHASTYFADVVWHGQSTRHIREGLEPQIDIERLRGLWSAISPMSYFRQFARWPRKSLIVYAKYDLTFLPEFSRQVVNEFERHGLDHKVVVLPCGHYTTGEAPYKYMDGWHLASFCRTAFESI